MTNLITAEGLKKLQEEFDHLAWCESRLQELGSRPSVLNPLFYGLSYGIGALAGFTSLRLRRRRPIRGPPPPTGWRRGCGEA